MNSKLSIKIKKRTQAGWLIWFLIMFPFMLAALNEFLGFPYAIRYLLDAAWMLLLGMALCRKRKAKGINNLVAWCLLFFVYTLMVYLVQYQSALYYLWGTRNNFRFYGAFFSFILFLTQEDAEGYLRVFDKLFWVNALISIYQFFALGLHGDQLGGLFGTEAGGNGYTNIFFLIVISKSVIYYLEKRETVRLCFAKCAVALFVAALAELKFFFVEFILIVALAFLFTDFTWRKFWLIIGGGAAVAIGVAFLSTLFPYFTGWFSVSWLLETATTDRGYTYSGDLNRLNGIWQINEMWLRNWSSRLFGLGLGNCDTASFEFLNTPFFAANGDMHYTWLSYAMMYLECGWIGLFFYFGFFLFAFLKMRKIERWGNSSSTTCCRIAEIISVLCPIIGIYNSSLRTEAAYMVYFVLAIPFMMHKK